MLSQFTISKNDDKRLSLQLGHKVGSRPLLKSVNLSPTNETFKRILNEYRQYGVYFILCIILIAASIISPSFYSLRNLLNFCQIISPLGVVAVGQTFVILIGGIDFSVAELMAIVNVLTAFLTMGHNENIIWVFGLCLFIGCTVGFINGFFISRFNVNPFVMTLSMLLILQGIRFVYFGVPIGNIPSMVRFMGIGRIGPLPCSFVIFLGIVLLGFIILKKTTLGRYIYSVGANERTAYLSGVKIHKTRIMTYIMCSISAVISGMILTGYLGLADAWAGQGYEFDSITAVILGGMPLTGGEGGVSGTIAGVLILIILFNLLHLIHLQYEAQLIVKGLIMVIALAIYKK